MSTSPRIRKWIALSILLVGCLSSLLLMRSWSAVGATLADPLRKVVGVRAVAQLETLVFSLQDEVTRLSYGLGLSEPESPFQSEQLSADSETPLPTVEATPAPASPTPEPVLNTSERSSTATPAPEPTPASTPTATPWTLPDAAAFGDLPGEGVWKPYLFDLAGDTVAVRTFFQPDPERPFALVAVAALDLTRTELRFVLGLKEPARPGGPHGSGLIPAEDRQPGRLLAAFNGGFIADHGGYGAMQDGLVAMAARSGLATLAILDDGSVRLGEWNTDLFPDAIYRSWRQNALMILHDGAVNEKVHTGSWIEWGANLDYSVETVRSAVGLSAENDVLYYFAGPSLSMPVLAEAMAAAGVHNGMLLDINPTHAHFTRFYEQDGRLIAEPLFEEEMDYWVDRYLAQWDQDFFYIMLREGAPAIP